MTKKAKMNFRGKVVKSAERRQRANSSTRHLNLPQGMKMFIPDPDGTVYLDFLPYLVTETDHPDKNEEDKVAIKGSYWWERPYRLHRNIGAEPESVVCLSSFKKKCPICTERTKMRNEDAEEDDIKALNSSDRNLYIVIPRRSKKYEEVPYIFDISQYNFGDLLFKELKENPKYEIFPDPEKGYTLKIRFDAKTIGTSKPFPEANRIDFIKRSEAIDEDLLEDLPELSELLIEYSYKELKAKFQEVASEDDGEEDGGDLHEDEEDEDDDDRPKKGKKVKGKRHKDDDDEDDDEDEDDDDDDDDAEEDEDDEDDDEDDEDDDEDDEDDDEDDEDDEKPKGKSHKSPQKRRR